MLLFDEKQLKQMLMENEGYSSEYAEYAVERIKQFHEALQPILDQWMKDRSISDHAVNGVTLGMVYQYITTDFFDALVSLAVFAEMPTSAEYFLDSPKTFRKRW